MKIISKQIRYLHKTPEAELIDLSLEFPFPTLSPLSQIFGHMGVPYPNCWIGLRIPTEFLTKHFPNSFRIPNNYKIPGDLDIIGGPLLDGLPTDYIVGVEVKRFRYMVPGNLKSPDAFGRKQIRGYTLFGLNRVMLCHFVVAEPVHNPNYHDFMLNASIISDGMGAVNNMRVGIDQSAPCGYCIAGWAQVSHKDPIAAGGLPSPFIIKPAPDNPLGKETEFGNIRHVLLEQITEKLQQNNTTRKNASLPIVIDFAK